MTGVHPEFDPKASTCWNCAAFVPDHKADNSPPGECHRHAPSPTFGEMELDRNGRTCSATSEPDPEIYWPSISPHSPGFCCEWVPGKPMEREL